MSSSHNDDHHVTEQKPVAFTVPLIMASVLVLIIVLFLSLCDTKAHHEAGHGDHMAPVEAADHNAAMEDEHNAKMDEHDAKMDNKMAAEDSVSAETDAPTAEPAKANH